MRYIPIDSQGRQVYSSAAIPESTNIEFGRDFAVGIFNVAVIYTDGGIENHKILKTK